jgi:transcriptional regulator with XRE-family HTH domain
VSIGERLQTLREARGMDRDSLALKVGVEPGAIRKVEQSENRQPAFQNGVQIAKTLGVWPDELAFDKAFRSHISFDVDGEVVELRLRFQGSDVGKNRAVVRALRELIGKGFSVSAGDDAEQIAAVEVELLALRERTESAMEILQRLKAN